jgi:hypothetical protein
MSQKTDMTVIKNSDMKVMWKDRDVEVLKDECVHDMNEMSVAP